MSKIDQEKLSQQKETEKLPDMTENEKKQIQKTKNKMQSIVNSAITINALHYDTLDLNTIADEIISACEKVVTDGNTKPIEVMLMAQAKTLDTLFNNLLAQTATIEMIDHFRVFTDVAFRAQNQCRKTLAVLANLKTPKATFIKQQNNAVNQQVNNALPNENQKKSVESANELLSEKEKEHETMDIGRANTAIITHSTVETMAEIHGPQIK